VNASRQKGKRKREKKIRPCGILTVCLTLFSTAVVAARSPQQDALASQSTLQQAAAAIERGDLAAASRIVEPALKAHPADPVLQNLAGVIAAQQKQFERAEVHFRRAIQLAPKNSAAYENLGRLYQERADAEPAVRAKALDVYRQLLSVEPANVEALFQSGVLLALDRQFAASRAALERLPEAMKGSPQTLAVLAADFAALGDGAAARRAVEALAVHPALTEADVLAALPALPGTEGDEIATSMLEALARRGLAAARSLRALAAIQVRAGRYGEARQALERVAAAEGASAPLLIELARTAIRLKDYEGALGYLAHARSLDPGSADVHFLFAMVCVEQNLGREAYESMKKAVELDPDNPLVNYAMGAIATNRHEPSESLPYFEKYVRLRPEDPRGHFALGAALFYSNLFDQARPELERATRSPETATGGHYFLARIARQINDLATARREVDRALQLNASLVEAWAELGLIQTRLEEYGPAEQSLAKALAIDPDHYAASVNLATLYAKTKDPRKDAQMAKVAALGEKRDERAQAFLRIIKAVPYGQ
jgi:tetratricopeptide (TPR) repeat protein